MQNLKDQASGSRSLTLSKDMLPKFLLAAYFFTHASLCIQDLRPMQGKPTLDMVITDLQRLRDFLSLVSTSQVLPGNVKLIETLDSLARKDFATLGLQLQVVQECTHCAAALQGLFIEFSNQFLHVSKTKAKIEKTKETPFGFIPTA